MTASKGDDISDREWMPNIDVLVTVEDLPVNNVSPPEENSSQIVMECAKSSPEGYDSAKGMCAFRSCSTFRSVDTDSPASTARSENKNSEKWDERWKEWELMNVLVRNRQNKSDNEDPSAAWNCDFESLKNTQPRLKRRTFDGLRQTWELQRDLLMERLAEKDGIILKQSKMLARQLKQLNAMEESIDALETRFEQEIEYQKVQIERHEQRCLKQAQSVLETRDAIEKSQLKMKKDFKKLTISTPGDIQSLEIALTHRTSLYTQSECEKQAVVKKLDAANEELKGLRGEVLALTEKLKNANLRQAEKQDKGDEVPRSETDAESSETVRIHPSAKLGKKLADLKKENTDLKRDVMELREQLIDLKEHSEQLESQAAENQELLKQAWCLKQEVETLRKTHQDRENLFAANQKTMQGLKSEPNYKRLVLASSGALNCLKVEMEHKETSESSVNQVFDALKHIEEFQQLLIRAQTERDEAAKEVSRLNGVVRSMTKEAKATTRQMNQLQRDRFALTRTVNLKNSEISLLQTNLRVATLVHSSAPVRLQTGRREDPDVIRELLKSKVALAEMNEVVIQLRQEIASFKNKTSKGKSTPRFFKRICGAFNG